MFRKLRSVFFIIQVISLLFPLLGVLRRKKFSIIAKDIAVLLLTNPDLLWKYLEKLHLTPEAIKKILFKIKK